LKEIFILIFIYEDGFKCIDEALKEIKDEIFKIHVEVVAWV